MMCYIMLFISVLCEIKEKTVLSLRNLNDEVRLGFLISFSSYSGKKHFLLLLLLLLLLL